ncbi:MAG TPA: type II toxin-antitoxin system RelB/DinJ family antitoxin [Candidatus Blautia merdigallinarum]|uniref:Type II toxin-antitoxin system RelB/DinJ family antitoxin n=1 Tax=Candidatus Blautia merdigallinarum TaxID=2838495 RepID=A0A9D2SK77_9FIRM|nr:type II toxin-antitoxin system RelB/DinJ family antitoxin [Candidatus Blautia merdigallinarum]
MGMSMTTAFTIFAKTVTREKRIPFEVTADPFYSDSNLAHLYRGIKELNEENGVEHDLIKDKA